MQTELFDVSRPTLEIPKVERHALSGWLDQFRVTLRIDHLLIGGISALVLYVLVFSFGVEKGKRYAFEELKAERARQEQTVRELADAKTPSLHTLKGGPPVPETRAASPAVAPGAVPLVTAPAAGEYTIQLATYLTRRQAEESASRFKQKGFHGFVVSKGKYFLLCIEAFQDLVEARARLTRLKADGFVPADSFIRPAKGIVSG